MVGTSVPPCCASVVGDHAAMASSASNDGFASQITAALTRTELKAHHQECRQRKCMKCRWFKLGRKWQKKHVLGNGQTWLAAGCTDGKFGLGCAACAKLVKEHRLAGAWLAKGELFCTFTVCGPNFNPSHLYRHSKTSMHKEAEANLDRAVASECAKTMAPPLSDFITCWEGLRKGRSARDGGVSSDKKALMRWCISEAILEQDRAFLRKAKTIAFTRDSRHNRLLVRFRAATAQLEVRSGVFGLRKNIGQETAETLVKETTRMIRIFATPRHAPPSHTRLLEGGEDKQITRRIKNRLEIVVSDSANNELLAADQGRGRRAPADATMQSLHPNLILAARDAAHASRRKGMQSETKMEQGRVTQE